MRTEGVDDALPMIFTTAEAMQAGLTRHEIAGMVRRGAWVRMRTGVYCRARSWEAADRSARHVHRAVAAARRRPGTVLSHLSAAAWWQWRLPLGELPTVWLTKPPGPSASTADRPGVRVEVATLDPSDSSIAPRARVGVTSRARTVADCLRHLAAADSVAVADAAVAAHLSRHVLLGVLDRQAGWPYAERGRDRLALVDPRRESWLESWSVVRLHQRGIPLPEAQATVRDRRGRRIARVDWWWPEHGVVGEADGREKYRRAGLRTPDDAEQRLREEKAREDRLRDAGLEVVRYGTADADAGIDDLVERVVRALTRGDPARVRAHIAPAALPSWW